MAEMVVRKIEEKWAMQEKKKAGARLARAFASYKSCKMFVDTSADPWKLVYLNDQTLSHLGKPVLHADIW